MNKLLVLLVFVALIFTNCIKKETSPELPDISIIDISQETDWDYLVLGRDDYFYVQSDGYNPKLVLFHSAEANQDYYITFSNSGYIDKVIVKDYIFIFDNFNGKYLDIGIVYPNGDIEILREIETDFNWDNLTLKSANSSQAFSDVIRGAARVVAGVPCALAVAGTIASGGIAIPLAAWTCGNFLLGLTADVMTNDFEVHNGFTEFVDRYGTTMTIIGCSGIDIAGCATDAASMGLHEWANYQEDLEERNEEVLIVGSALRYSTGDVQVTLRWDDTNDIDLIVEDPSGDFIWWGNQFVSSGGQLDIDDRDGYGPENIFWNKGAAPKGEYNVYIDFYSGYGSSEYTVLVQAMGIAKKFKGTISSSDELLKVISFDTQTLTFKSAQIEKDIPSSIIEKIMLNKKQ